MFKIGTLLFLVLCILSIVAQAQRLPATLTRYLDRNYRGWKLAGECSPTTSENTSVLKGDFDGNEMRDYAVKFVRGGKGFVMAFLADGRKWKPFYLHIYSADEAKSSDLMLFEKGDKYELGDSAFTLKADAPADFRCESDVGGVHVFRNNRFIGY